MVAKDSDGFMESPSRWITMQAAGTMEQSQPSTMKNYMLFEKQFLVDYWALVKMKHLTTEHQAGTSEEAPIMICALLVWGPLHQEVRQTQQPSD